MSNIDIDAEWEEYLPAARATQERAAAILAHALGAAQGHARQLLGQAAAARAQQQAHEEQIRQEVAATARAATLAEVAQGSAPAPTAPPPVRATPATPPPVRDDRASIHRALLADLEDLGIATELGNRLITAVARGQIPHLSISY